MKMTMTKTLRPRHRAETRKVSAAVTFERPLPDELSVKVVVGPMGDDAMVRVSIGRRARKPYARTQVEAELAHPGG